MRATPMTATAYLVEAIRKGPYAFHSEADVEGLVADLATNPTKVAEALESDASCHEDCDNWIKADVLRTLAGQVRSTVTS